MLSIVFQGKVPRNEYGNVELFLPCMLPPGTRHIQSMYLCCCSSSNALQRFLPISRLLPFRSLGSPVLLVRLPPLKLSFPDSSSHSRNSHILHLPLFLFLPPSFHPFISSLLPSNLPSNVHLSAPSSYSKASPQVIYRLFSLIPRPLSLSSFFLRCLPLSFIL